MSFLAPADLNRLTPADLTIDIKDGFVSAFVVRTGPSTVRPWMQLPRHGRNTCLARATR